MLRSYHRRKVIVPNYVKGKAFWLIGITIIGLIYSGKAESNPVINETNKTAVFTLANGVCTETYTTKVPCHSWIVLHGSSMYSKGTLGFFYFLFLMYLFLGIAIVADIFMGSIEVITR